MEDNQHCDEEELFQHLDWKYRYFIRKHFTSDSQRR